MQYLACGSASRRSKLISRPQLWHLPNCSGLPQEPALLAGEQKRFFALHCVSALVGHVKGVRAQIAVSALRSRSEGLVVVTQLLEDALSLFEKSLLEMNEILFRHRLRFFAASCSCHF